MTSPRRAGSADPAIQRIARAIRQDIEAGILRDGEALPSTRALAAQWGVSSFPVSEACKILAEEGLLINISRSKRVVHAPDQAHRHERKPSVPQVVLIGGYAGSGKTELGRILVRETGWPLLDKDSLTRPVVEAALQLIGHSPHDRESDTYLNEVRPYEYEALINAAVENVECGNSALVTAPFLREFTDAAWLSRTEATFSSLKAKTTIVWVACDPSSMQTYIRRRGAARDAAKLADWPAYLKTIDLDFRPGVPHLLVDNSVSSAPLQAQAKDLVRTILDRDV